MSDAANTPTEGPNTWRFPKAFWVANSAEMFERAAFYGMFIALTLYLTREIGFTDVETGWIVGFFSAFLYLVPTFTGALADKIGFRRALMLAFLLLTAGYALLGAFQTKPTAIFSLVLIILGGAFVKPIISGTVAKSSDDRNRARAFAIFYQVVNIGAFLGKTVARPLRVELGLASINLYAACMAFCAFLVVLFFFRDIDSTGEGKSFRELIQGLMRVVRNGRFMALILIVAGFWVIQGQLYASMPKYVLRMVGEGASPEWLANVNPFMVVLLVVPITHLVRRLTPVASIGIGLAIIPLSALTIALSPLLESATGNPINILGIAFHPITVAMIVGIALQGVAECFLSPRFLEYASKQAPPGEVGLYMGYSHLTTFFAWLVGFVLSGYLLDAFVPDPRTLSPEVYEQYQSALANNTALPQVYAHANYIWFIFAGIGVFAFLCLQAFRMYTARVDQQRAAAG